MAPRIKPGGVSEYIDALGNVTTFYCSTCSHCQHQTEFPSMREMHKYVDVCRSCMKLICLSCCDKPCDPWIKSVERQEARGRMFRDMGIG